jgi:hypothetical protein
VNKLAARRQANSLPQAAVVLVATALAVREATNGNLSQFARGESCINFVREDVLDERELRKGLARAEEQAKRGECSQAREASCLW